MREVVLVGGCGNARSSATPSFDETEEEDVCGNQDCQHANLYPDELGSFFLAHFYQYDRRDDHGPSLGYGMIALTNSP